MGSFLLAELVLLNKVVHEFFRLNKAIVIPVKCRKYTSEIPLFLLVELLLFFELGLRLEMLLLISDVLLLFLVFFIIDGLKVIAHVLGLFGVLHCFLGARVQISITHREIIEIHN